MAANTSSNSGRAVWQIDRFELVFYNPRHRRWQYFAEDPLAPSPEQAQPDESLHRRQIRNLLKSIHDILAKLLEKSDATFRLRNPRQTEDKLISIFPPKFVKWRTSWPVYLHYLVATAASEGLPKREFDALVEFVRKCSLSPESPQNIKRTTALAILSILPILEEWDTWGCLLNSSNECNAPRMPAFLKGTPESWPSPVYLFDFDFSKGLRPGAKSQSERILGTNVAIQGAACKSEAGVETVLQGPLADFFGPDYCHVPANGEELALYRCYANLVDPIQKQLSGESAKRQFVAVYPIPTDGRLHFLQLAFSTASSNATSMKELWHQWSPIHREIWTPRTRELLQNQIQHVQVLAFQTEARAELTRIFRPSSPIDERALKTTIHKFIYHLFPVEYIESKDRGYTYFPYRYSRESRGYELLVGQRWKETPKPENGEAPLAPSETAIAPLKNLELGLSVKHNNEVSRLWAEHEVRLVLEEQLEHLQLLQYSLAEENRRKEENRKLCARIVYAWLTGLSQEEKKNLLGMNDLRTLFATEISVPGLATPSGYADWKFQLRPNCFERYLTQGFPDGTKESYSTMIKSILQPSLLLQLSEYFETGPVMLLTHSITEEGAQKLFLGDTNSLSTSARTMYQELHDQIESRLGSAQTKKSGRKQEGCDCTVISFHEKHTLPLTEEDSAICLAGLDNPTATDCRDRLMVQELVLGNVRWTLDGGHRFWGLCPGCHLKAFNTAYGRDIRRKYRSKTPIDLSRTQTPKYCKTEVLYASPYHKDKQEQIYLMQIYFWLPYRIDDFAKVVTGHLCKAWVKAGIEIGELFYYCHETTKVSKLATMPDVRFADDPRAGDVIKGLLQPSESGLVIRLEHWKMDDQSKSKESEA